MYVHTFKRTIYVHMLLMPFIFGFCFFRLAAYLIHVLVLCSTFTFFDPVDLVSNIFFFFIYCHNEIYIETNYEKKKGKGKERERERERNYSK